MAKTLGRNRIQHLWHWIDCLHKRSLWVHLHQLIYLRGDYHLRNRWLDEELGVTSVSGSKV